MSIPHPRLILGALLGALGWAAARGLGAPVETATLIGWNLGAGVFLFAVGHLYVTATESDVRDRAGRNDEPTAVIVLLAAMAIAASLTAVWTALGASPSHPAAGQAWGRAAPALAVVTLASSWFVVQSLFIGHYAHRHFQAVAAGGDKAGFLFPGDPPGSYMDFAYLAICIGATAQVSDPGVQTRPLRNLVTAHAVTSFFYNTAVLALGVNILSGLLGH